MIYLIVWLVGAIAVTALYSAGRATMRAEEAYQLARSGMEGHFHVADVLAEHQERIEMLDSVPFSPDEFVDFSEFAEGGTTDEQD